MDRAKGAVSDFLHRSGKHDTTVDERVAPAVTNEHITPTRHENVQTVVDKEIHQDHHHTSVQPVQAQEVLPEKHSHNLAGVKHTTHDHTNPDEIRQRLDAERAQFQDTSTTHDTKYTQSAAPTVGGEHIHHHVHETVQPVVHKETIQPSVVHTTVPIHETHHKAAEHHGVSELPAMTLDEFKNNGGSLTGRDERHGTHAGCPDPANPGNMKEYWEESATGGHHHGHHHGTNTSTTTGLDDSSRGGQNYGNERDYERTGDRYGTDGSIGQGNQGLTGNGSESRSKPSLMDKLNPKKDADGDGKPGFMK